MRYTRITSTFALLFAVVGVQAQPVSECKGLFNRASLLLEHLQCTGATSIDDLAIYFNAGIWEHTYQARFDSLPDDLKRRAAAFGADKRGRVVVVAKPRPEWVEAQWRPQQSTTGAKTALVGVPLQCIVGPGPGHAKFSEEAASAMGWSHKAARLLGLSSRDTDEYEWSNEIAHALNPSTPSGAPTPRSEAIDQFDAWLILTTSHVKDACSKKQFVTATYLAGYVLHSVQDLALHSGMTRERQAILTWTSASPEADTRRVVRANDWTRKALSEMDQALPAACLSGMKKLDTLTRPPGIAQAYFGHRDRTKDSMDAFRKLGKSHDADPGKSSALEWFDTSDAKAASEFFEVHVRNAIRSAAAAAPKMP